MYTKMVGNLSRDDMIKVVVKSRNKEDKFAVAIMKGNCLVGYFSKKIIEGLQKLFATFYFLLSFFCQPTHPTEV